MLNLKNKNKSGFSTVEILLSIALFAMLVLALSSALAMGVQQQIQNTEEAKAIYLMDEGLEASSNINSQGFINMSIGIHGLSTGSGSWAFSGVQDVVDNYTRKVTISSVDANTVDAVVSISWISSMGRARSISTTERFTNYKRAIVTASWLNPTTQSTVNMSGDNSSRVGIQVKYLGTKAYIIKGKSVNPNFAEMNFSNPALPSQTWTFNTSSQLLDVFVSGNYAWVATNANNGEIAVINLTTHAQVLTMNVTGNNIGARIYYSNNYLYVLRTSQNSQQLVIYNVSNPLAPVQSSISTINGSIKLIDIVVSGNYAYISSSANNGELLVVDVTTKTAPVFRIALDLPGNTNGAIINILNNTVFMGQEADNNIYVINVGNPLAPALLGTYDIGGVPSSFTFGSPNNNYMFVASTNSAKEFQTIDISNLNALSSVGFVNTTLGLNYVTYVPASDIVLGASSDVAGEFVIFKPN